MSICTAHQQMQRNVESHEGIHLHARDWLGPTQPLHFVSIMHTTKKEMRKELISFDGNMGGRGGGGGDSAQARRIELVMK